MIYRNIQLIQIFLAHGRVDGRTKVFQEVLADLKTIFEESIIDIAASRLLLQIKPAILQFIKSVLVGFELFLTL